MVLLLGTSGQICICMKFEEKIVHIDKKDSCNVINCCSTKSTRAEITVWGSIKREAF